jgi:hypothetical protein
LGDIPQGPFVARMKIDDSSSRTIDPSPLSR